MAQQQTFGNLDLLVINAVNLKDLQTFGKQDPYCKLDISGQHFETKVHTDGGKNPSWNQHFSFINISPEYSKELAVVVMNKNVMSADQEIGHARVPLAPAFSGRGATEMRVPLVTEKGKAAGELCLVLTWKPFEAPRAAAAPGGALPAGQPGAYPPLYT